THAGARAGGVQGVPRVRCEGVQGRSDPGEDQGAHRARHRPGYAMSVVHRRAHEEGVARRRVRRGDRGDDLRRYGDGRGRGVESRRARTAVSPGAQELTAARSQNDLVWALARVVYAESEESAAHERVQARLEAGMCLLSRPHDGSAKTTQPEEADQSVS